MNNSYWIEKTNGKHYPPLTDDKNIHTLIIGAGLSGLTSAYYLSSVTSNVLVIEADQIGYGASGRNTGKVTSQHGLIYQKLIQLHGIEKAKLYYQAQEEAIASIASIIEEHQIDCDWERKSSILYTKEETKISQIQDEYQACLDLGIPCTYLDQGSEEVYFATGIEFPNQGSYDPYRYLLGLSHCLDAEGIQIYEHSSAKAIVKDGSGWDVTVNGHHIHTQNIICTTQMPLLDAFTFLYAKTYPSISHLALFAHQTNNIDMMFSIDDPMESYHGFQTQLLCGGYEHRCGMESPQDYEAWILSLQKKWDQHVPEYVWDSQDLVSYDHFPMIGPLSQAAPNFYIACGFSKWGNTNANVAGKLLSAMILHQEHNLAPLFQVHRASSLLQPNCFKMNIKTAFALIKSWFPSFADQDCAIHEGKTIELGNHPYGMYRDAHDELYIVDLMCPHMGCVCQFNAIDHTWDCPCHGSRFSYDGTIIKGPAQSALSPYQEGRNKVDPHEGIKKK